MTQLLIVATALRLLHPQAHPFSLQTTALKQNSPSVGYFSTTQNRYPRWASTPSPRKTPGISQASCGLPTHSTLLWGTAQNAGFVTYEIGRQLEGRKFKNFCKFRKAFWKAVAQSSHIQEFSVENQERMTAGKAPLAPEGQQIKNQLNYELHHIQPIHRKGAVYDPCNLMVVTPRYHEEVLFKSYHYQQNGKPTEYENRNLEKLR